MSKWNVKVHTTSANYSIDLEAKDRETAKQLATILVIEAKPNIKQGPVYTYATLKENDDKTLV